MESTVDHYLETFGIDELEAQARIARSPAYGELSGWVETTYGDDDRFGGVWIDQDAGGTLVVAMTSEDAVEELHPAIVEHARLVAARHNQDGQSIGALLGIGVTLPLQTKIVEHSYGSLIDASRVVQEVHEEAGLPASIAEYAVLPMENTVSVTLFANYSSEAKEKLREGLVHLSSVSFVESEKVSTRDGLAACPVSDCQLQGAVRYISDGTGVVYQGGPAQCSVGFTGTRDGEVGFFSAGHCVWYPNLLGVPLHYLSQTAAVPHFVTVGGNDLKVGDSRAASFHMTAGGQLVDVSFVSLNAVGQALLSPGNFWNPFNWTPVVDAPEIPRANATLGDVYCRSGFREEDDHLPHCGQLYTKTPLGRLSNVTACQGDSGGPVLRQSDHIALGITHGIPNVPGATSCPTSDMSYVAFTFLSDDLAEIGGSIDGK